MNDIDTTFKTGRIVGDPTMSYAQSGLAILEGRICSVYTKRDGVKKENTVKFKLFGESAEHAGRVLKAGMSVMMEGKTTGSEREFKGKTYHDLMFMVNSVKLLKDEESSEEVPF